MSYYAKNIREENVWGNRLPITADPVGHTLYVFINTKMLILKKRDINIELLMLSATFLLTLY